MQYIYYINVNIYYNNVINVTQNLHKRLKHLRMKMTKYISKKIKLTPMKLNGLFEKVHVHFIIYDSL